MGRILTRKAINKTFTDCSKVDSSLALRVSCLNFEPWSQSFPVILAKMANITIATITSLFYCFTFYPPRIMKSYLSNRTNVLSLKIFII